VHDGVIHERVPVGYDQCFGVYLDPGNLDADADAIARRRCRRRARSIEPRGRLRVSVGP
jgi:hypothetical protein